MFTISELSEEEQTEYQVSRILNMLTDAVQNFMDNKAGERHYDNLLSACTYANSSVPTFKSEGMACVEWRDSVWSYCYSLLSEVQQGLKPIPSKDELIQSLPQLIW